MYGHSNNRYVKEWEPKVRKAEGLVKILSLCVGGTLFQGSRQTRAHQPHANVSSPFNLVLRLCLLLACYCTSLVDCSL